MPRDVTPEQLRAVVQSVVRSMGLLAVDRTPCGHPLSVSEAHALMALLRWPKHAPARGPTLRDLRDVLGLDKSNVTRLTQRLERAGLVASRSCRLDGRAKRIGLTRKGRRLATTVSASSHAEFVAVLEHIPRDSRWRVVQALELLADAIRVRREPTSSPTAAAS